MCVGCLAIYSACSIHLIFHLISTTFVENYKINVPSYVMLSINLFVNMLYV